MRNCGDMKHCVRNMTQLDGKSDYNLIKSGMFGRYDSSYDSNSDPFLPFISLENMIINVIQFFHTFGVRDY